MDDFETIRPLHGLIGHVFSEGADHGERLLDALARGLDQGEGWALVGPTTLHWYVGPLAVEVEIGQVEFESNVQEFAEMSIVLVENVSQCPRELLKLLNQLNSQSAGWVVWFDSERGVIRCSIRIPLIKSKWWWVIVLWRTIPAAVTMAEANAAWLAELSGGVIARRNHPILGARLEHDSWIDGVLLGPREPVSSMGLMVSSLDLAQMREVLESRDRVARVGLSWPMTVSLHDNRDLMFAQLREHWHSEFGLGWQFTSVGTVNLGPEAFEDGPSFETLELAASANEKLLTSNSCIPVVGGWVVASPFGVIRHAFLPAPVVEEVQVLSQSTFGTVAGLLVVMIEEAYESVATDIGAEDVDEFNEKFEDQAHSLNLKNGFLSHSTLMPLDANDDSGELARGDGHVWVQPRHALVCSFGTFNPAGPTVSSLELSFSGHEWIVYWVMRHPFGPEIIEVGRSSGADMAVEIARIIEDCIADGEASVLGSGCDWMEVRLPQFEDAIGRGMDRFARSSQGVDFGLKCRRIVGGQCDPWETLELGDNELPDLEIVDEVDLWIDLVSDPSVFFGYQAFMRSAWEGSKLFAVADFDGAQSTANSINFGVRERILDDFAFRNNQGLLIQHPTIK